MATVVLAEIPNPVHVVTDGASAVGGYIAGKAADTFLEPVGHAIAKGVAGAAKKVGEELLHFVTTSATVDFRQGWWANDRAQTLVREIATLALVLTLLFLMLAVVQGLFAGDIGGMVRATLIEVPVTIGATVALVAVTELLLGLVDGASAMVLAGVPEALGHFFEGFGTAASIESQGVLGILMVMVFLLGAILVWIELVVRSSLIYLLMAAAPLTLAARVWPAARGAWRRLAELGIALIVSKFAIALALGLGAAALAGAGPKQGDLGTQAGLDLASLMTGASIMLLAAFTPFIVLKLLPIVEGAVIAQGISRSPVRAAQTGMQAGYYANGLSRMAGAKSGGGGRRPALPPGAPPSATPPSSSPPSPSPTSPTPGKGGGSPLAGLGGGGAGAGATAPLGGLGGGGGAQGAAVASAGPAAIPVGAMVVAATTAKQVATSAADKAPAMATSGAGKGESS